MKQQPTRRRSETDPNEARRQYRRVLQHWAGDYLRWRAVGRWPGVRAGGPSARTRHASRATPAPARFADLYTGSVLDD